jgi:hypothetical protein
MAWLSRVNFIASDTLSFSDINNLGNDIRAWGGNVNGGGYVLSNVVLSAFDLSTCFNLPISTGVSGLGTGVATFLATPSSANLAAALTDETGTGANVFATSPTLVTPTVTTSAVIPLVNGGTGVSSTLTLQSTSGAGTSDAIIFKTASQSERMRIDTLGRVQIGGTSGLELANVVGSYKSYGWHNTGAAANEKYWRHQAHDSNRSLMIQALNDAYSAAATPFEIVRNSGTYTTQYVLLAQDGGNVGIGTTSPGATLPSGMTAGAKVIEVRGAATNIDVGLFLRRSDGVTGLDIWHDCSSDANYDTRFVNIFSGSAFAFYNGTAEQLRITSGGNVGIGTASPAASAKLDIGGTTGALLVPRLTTTERNALTAVNGMIIYNTTDNQMQGRINGAWSAM